jgi:cholest-4-en-3-one 26-monooxygenase
MRQREGLEVNDLVSPDTFLAGVPHELFARLRREDPVALTVDQDGSHCWAVTRHADVVAASRDTVTFSSALGRPLAGRADGQSSRSTGGLPLINMDPPAHAQYRKTIAWCFSPKATSVMERSIQEQATSLITSALAKGEIDFVTEVAARLPLAVISGLLGIEPTDYDLVLRWSNRIVAPDDLEYNSSPQATATVQAEAFSYFHELAVKRIQHPGDDLISVIARAEVDGATLPAAEIATFCILLLIGGNETTRNTIAHCCLALARNPGVWTSLQGQPALIPVAVEEVLRFASALMHARRVVTRDTTIGGRKIAAGDAVALWYASANRDEEVFEAPDRLDVVRTTNPHLTFGGGGPHVCLGGHLARLELAAILGTLLDQTGSIEVIEGPVRLRSSVVNGIKHLRVNLVPRSRQ